MEPHLDILLWDDDRYRIQAFYRKCPARSIRRVINDIDFICSLERKPRLVVLNKIQRYGPEHFAQILRARLTSDAFVVTVGDDRLHWQDIMVQHGVPCVSFEIDNHYLWISVHNILQHRGQETWNNSLYDFSD